LAEQEILIVDKSLVHCCAITKNVTVASRGAARIFLRGGGGSYGSKSLEKEKLLVIRIVKEST